MDVTLVVDVISDVTTATPRLETDTEIMSIGLGRPLEDAYRSAHADLVQLISDLTGLDQLDAYQLLSQAGRAHVGNVVDENYTIAAAIDKEVLDRALPYRGAHQRLRRAGAIS